jgi:putative transcriptional regulator
MAEALVTKEKLLREVLNVLAMAGFYALAVRCAIFDIIARRDNTLLLIKILTNANSLTQSTAQKLKVLAKFLDVNVCIVSERLGARKTTDSVVYLRYGLPIVSKNTFADIWLEGVLPIAYAAGGGYYVLPADDVLRAARDVHSLGTLARVAGVSRRSIQKYEKGCGMSVEEFLGVSIAKPIDPFARTLGVESVRIDALKPRDVFETHVLSLLRKLGYQVAQTPKCPFDALARDAGIVILTGMAPRGRDALSRARIISQISRVAERYSAFFVKRVEKDRYRVTGIPFIELRELKDTKTPEDMVNLIKDKES